MPYAQEAGKRYAEYIEALLQDLIVMTHRNIEVVKQYMDESFKATDGCEKAASEAYDEFMKLYPKFVELSVEYDVLDVSLIH